MGLFPDEHDIKMNDCYNNKIKMYIFKLEKYRKLCKDVSLNFLFFELHGIGKASKGFKRRDFMS